ncbi:uncharacterized protein FA14DRAFT_179119 [Meira miltonrushii]|uniref:EF-hand domain-containing protein n=1 Tax=Meira miltonrushii TaxID=1280837 RepID=A0A316VEM1_9BASI|nr:uncharacterized protein FA14DRAFT_179119 [Meira miltonrushii]PWN35754.1 hypothetical protein FA14DRAFT_179119 [Meira miltonrushii]
MSLPFMQELNQQQWGTELSRGHYSRLSTRSEIIFPYDDTYHDDSQNTDNIPLIEKEYQLLDGFKRGWPSVLPYSWQDTKKAGNRTRKVILFCFALTIFTASALTAYRLTIRSYDTLLEYTTIPPFAFGPRVPNATCCSSTPEYLPYTLDAIQAHQPFLDDEVLEEWVANGKLLSRADFSKHIRIDGVTTWVNGSDTRHHANRILFSEDQQRINEENMTTKDDKTVQDLKKEIDFEHGSRIQNSENRFRDLNELQFSVRSARQSLRHHLGTHHIVSTDFWRGEEPSAGVQDDHFGHHRGQIPQWLNVDSPLVALADSNSTTLPAIRLHHDSQIFVPFNKDIDAEQWRDQRLPTFNSMAVEAVLGINMKGLSQTYFLASDDMFTTHAMTTADFYTPLYGPSMQIQTDMYVRGIASAGAVNEIASMQYSVMRLTERFGTPGFSYSAHIHKSIVQPLMLESRMIWREHFEKASARRFRGDNLMMNSHTITYAMIIERHREALLWSFLVARIDKDGDGMLNDQELARALEEMGANNITSNIPVRLPKRITTHKSYQNGNLNKAKFPSPKASRPLFSSFDGYAYAEPDNLFRQRTLKGLFQMPLSLLPPSISESDDKAQQEKIFSVDFCQIELSVCWPRDDRAELIKSTNAIFKRFAFDYRGCGDCLITHLVGKSGEKGMKAFLPDKEQEFPQSAIIASKEAKRHDRSTDAYHLPLGAFHQSIDFSLDEIAIENGLGLSPSLVLPAQPNLRKFAMHLIMRYSYTIVISTGSFEMLKTPTTARLALEKVKKKIKMGMAYLCLNDDITVASHRVKMEMDKFFQDVWPNNRSGLPFELMNQ